MKIDLITVTRDNYEELFQTIESIRIVVNNNPNESKIGSLIIIDASTSPHNIQNDLLEFEKECKVETILVQESDNGIYDGMNKGIKYSKEPFVQFINSGDSLMGFVSTEDLSRIIKVSDIAGIASDVLLTFKNKNVKRRARIIRNIKKITMPAIHQGIIYKRQILQDIPYNIDYKICGDFDNICHLLSLNLKFLVVNKTTAALKPGGISTTRPLLLFVESTNIYKKFMSPSWWELQFYRFRLLKSMIIYQILFQLSKI